MMSKQTINVKSVVVVFIVVIVMIMSFNVEASQRRNYRLTSERQSCQAIVDCDACIKNPKCAWCKKSNGLSHDQPRCDTREWFKSDGNCSFPDLEDPVNEVQIVEDMELTSSESGSTGSSSSSSASGSTSQNKFVQISPQRVRLKLRPGLETQVTFRIAQAKHYPVDLYYLMDLSNSMSDDRKNIVKLGEKLATTIQRITSDFQIGFGSFVDKELMPYISLVQDDNCQYDNCPGPYSFQHQMKLSPNAKLFVEKVEEAPISGNIDNPEGGFDALLQVMVCEEQVGWRSQSRRVIVFTTDQSFHIACDGKLGGVVQPNDGLCHLNSTGYYTHSTKQDYPSVGQINHIAKEHSVNIIWAVTQDKFSLYKSLEGIVSGSSAGIISGDSSNVVELVEQQYETITTTIKAEHNASSNCEAKILTKCLNRPEYGPPECDKVELGTPVDMVLHVTLKDCVAETFAVSPIGLNAHMMVEIEPICDCPCSKEEEIDASLRCQSESCNRHGHLVCGTCQCCGDFYGPNCECSGVPEDVTDPDKTCRPQGTAEGSPVCSGRGDCVCGECVCDRHREGVLLTGQFCETVCDNTACERDIDGRLCSGHGECHCSFCKCDDGYSGDACTCKMDVDKCRSPESPNLVCSGNGECPCDRCICNDEEGYSGEFCEICVTCSDQCDSLRPCFECVAFEDPTLFQFMSKNGNPRNGNNGHDDHYDGVDQELLKNCSQHCNFIYQQVVPSRVPDEWNNCTFSYKNCEYTFSHSEFILGREFPHFVYHNLLEGPEFDDLPQEERLLKCPPKPDLIGILLGVIGCIVLVGLVTILLWKAFTTIHDRREFAKFEAERQRVKMPSHSNPIFRQATTTVQNPTFNSPNYY